MFVQRFMFRKRKTSLIRRLLEKAKKKRGATTGAAVGGAGGAASAAGVAPSVSPADDEQQRWEAAAKCLLKRLNLEQLEIMCRAVESQGKDSANCVLVPPDVVADALVAERLASHPHVLLPHQRHQPHVLCCQTWRWPDVPCGGQLKRLPSCSSASDPVYVCCNPYHWSRVCLPDFPPPPYSRFEMDRLKPEDRAPSEVPLVCRDTFIGSLATEDTVRNPREWCKLAYWEMTQRVGPLFPVEMHSVNVFGDVPIGDGLSLTTLALHNSPPELVCKTRCKIGLGVTLSREEDGVWMYNRSDNPVFVNSCTLEEPESQSPIRVPPDHCLCIFDPVKAACQLYGWGNFSGPSGPVNLNSVRISFVKGWGRQYRRQDITSCPCWLEILLEPCR